MTNCHKMFNREQSLNTCFGRISQKLCSRRKNGQKNFSLQTIEHLTKSHHFLNLFVWGGVVLCCSVWEIKTIGIQRTQFVTRLDHFSSPSSLLSNRLFLRWKARSTTLAKIKLSIIATQRVCKIQMHTTSIHMNVLTLV